MYLYYNSVLLIYSKKVKIIYFIFIENFLTTHFYYYPVFFIKFNIFFLEYLNLYWSACIKMLS